MSNTLVKLKAGSSRKPDLRRFFSPIWIHICASGFSTESTDRPSAALLSMS
ncbi:rCG22782, partial [Rattus norvegicus]